MTAWENAVTAFDVYRHRLQTATCQVGTRLRISTKTVSVHVSNVLAKLGAASRTEAATIARDRDLL